MQTKIVIDTNVLIGALIGKMYRANRELIELCFQKQFQPLINSTLFTKYESIISREEIISKSPYSDREINELFDAFFGICQPIKMYFLSQSYLMAENDNYLVELAVAGNAKAIVTHNTKDFQQSQLRFPEIKIEQPEEII